MDHSSNNLLTGGLDTLNEMKESMLELNGNKEKFAALTSEEEKLERLIENTQKDITEEISEVNKKRKKEIDDAFDEQIDKVRAKMRKVRDKRDKRKNTKVSERISAETETLREENHRLNLEAKTIFKQNHMLSLCNSKLYFALFSPGGFSDILTILGTIIITLLVIPCGIYYFLLPKEKILYLIIIYFITVIVFGGLYVFIGNHTKDKHPEAVKEVKKLRNIIKSNDRKIKAIKKEIIKDRDESGYGLENYDEELNTLDKEQADIANQKKEALLVFENTTSRMIADEIRAKHEDGLSKMKQDYDTICAEVKKVDARVKDLSIKVAREYEPFLGKEFLTPDKLEALTNIMQAGNAANISEALTFYKQNMN
jgi:uncharacterized phage infection (PIP) family protein YhgE